MLEAKKVLEENFQEIFGYEPGDDYEERVYNSLRKICKGSYTQEELVDITDTSVFSDGKEGVVLTYDAICMKDSANSTSSFIAKYKDIDYTHIKEDSFLGLDITALEINMRSGEVYRFSLERPRRGELQEFLDFAAEWYQTGENDEDEEAIEDDED